MGIFSLREYEDEGSMLVTLNFNGGDLSCTITSLLILYIHPWATFWKAYGSFSDQWDTTRQQWPHWTSVPSTWLCALNPPWLPFLLPPFLLNSEWMNRLLFSASFASLPLACSHCAAEYFLFILLSGGSSIKQYFASNLAIAYNTSGFWILSNQTLNIQSGKMWSLENVNLSKIHIFF